MVLVSFIEGLIKAIMKCHQGYSRPYPGAAESKILQQKLRKLVKHGLKGKRKLLLKKSNDNNSSRTYYLQQETDDTTGLFVNINDCKKSQKTRFVSRNVLIVNILCFNL
jgi:hypothetical protein